MWAGTCLILGQTFEPAAPLSSPREGGASLCCFDTFSALGYYYYRQTLDGDNDPRACRMGAIYAMTLVDTKHLRRV